MARFVQSSYWVFQEFHDLRRGRKVSKLYNSDFVGKPVVRVQYNKLEHLHMITQGNLRTAAVDYFENDLRHDSRLLTTNAIPNGIAILQYCNSQKQK